MLSRERLWLRLSGASVWPLAWALAGSCLMPWLVPERWNGGFSLGASLLGWTLVALALPLLLLPRWRLVPLILAAGWFTLLGLGRAARWEQSLPRGLTRLEGTLSRPWTVEGQTRRTSVEIRTPKELQGLELPLSLPEEGLPAPLPGTPVRFQGELRPIEPAPVLLMERPLWRARSDRAPRRIHLSSALQLEVLGPPRPGPLLRLQNFARARFDALPLPQGTARDLWGALTLGLPPAREEVFSAFVESGTLHTLVVSGLQVTLVMVAVEALWRRLARRGGSWAAIAAGLVYCAVVGFTAPVWRGLFMGLGWALGRGTGWKLPPVAGLHFALVIWLVGHPAAGCDPGFLLAWWALLGLVWGAEPLAGILSPLLGRAALPLARLAAPWFATLPLLAIIHGGAPTFGVFANLLVLPLVSLVTPLCLALTLLPLPGLTQVLGGLLAWTGDRLVPFFGHITPLATQWLWPWVGLSLGWLLLAQRAGQGRRTRALAAGLKITSLAFLTTGGVGRAPTEFSLEAIDIGQGDALLVRVPSGDATLLDTGPTPWSARRISRTLSRRGVREPLHLVLTHPHGDHAGGWSTLSRLRRLDTVALASLADPESWDPYRPAGAPAPETLLRGEGWTRGEAAFSVRWPPKPFRLPDPNLVSAVLRVRVGEHELWLMGDALAIQERDLLDLGDPPRGAPHRALKVGHHGSRNSTDPAWLEALAPEVAIISAGRRNPFGHPHPETLDSLGGRGIPAFISGPSRGVRIQALAQGWSIETGLGTYLAITGRKLPR